MCLRVAEIKEIRVASVLSTLDPFNVPTYPLFIEGSSHT